MAGAGSSRAGPWATASRSPAFERAGRIAAVVAVAVFAVLLWVLIVSVFLIAIGVR